MRNARRETEEEERITHEGIWNKGKEGNRKEEEKRGRRERKREKLRKKMADGGKPQKWTEELLQRMKMKNSFIHPKMGRIKGEGEESGG